jgi:putative copper export protein
VLPVHAATVRLFIHVLAATIWVGGQLVLAGLVPTLRPMGPDAVRAVARQYDRIAWTAYAVLIATGVWNLMAVHVGDTTSAYQTTVLVKLLVVAISGVGAAVHRATKRTALLAIGGAASSLGAIAALGLGILLRT